MTMWRDRWFKVGVIGTVLSCVACLTTLGLLALGAVGLGVWTGYLDAILLLVLVLFAGLAAYRCWIARRSAH